MSKSNKTNDKLTKSEAKSQFADKLSEAFTTNVTNTFDFDADSKLMQLIKESDSNIDENGIPTALEWERIKKEVILPIIMSDKWKAKVMKKLLADADFEGYNKEDVEGAVTYAMGMFPQAIDIVGEKIGSTLQQRIRFLENLFKGSVKRKPSKKTGVTYDSTTKLRNKIRTLYRKYKDEQEFTAKKSYEKIQKITGKSIDYIRDVITKSKLK